MASQNRHSQRYLSELARDPQALYPQGFEPLLRYLDANSPLHLRLGHSISLKQDPFRLGQTPIMHFHASAYSHVIRQPESGQYKLNNVYWGMFGINGPLPLHFTEFAIERNFRHQDKTLTEFCDLFHHRFLSLFYRSWAVSQPTISHDRPDDDYFADWTRSFCGYTDSSSARSETQSKLTKAKLAKESLQLQTFLSGLYSNKNRSGDTLRQIVSEYVQHPVTINQFEGQWYDLPEDAQCRLGRNTAALGSSTVIGKQVFQRGYQFSILVGPLAYADYLLLVDNPQHFEMIKKLATRHIGSEFTFTIKLLIRQGDIHASSLGDSKLGANAWLSSNNKKIQKQDDSALVAYQYACQ